MKIGVPVILFCLSAICLLPSCTHPERNKETGLNQKRQDEKGKQDMNAVLRKGPIEVGGVPDGFFVRLVDIADQTKIDDGEIKIGSLRYIKCERKFEYLSELRAF